ESPNADEHEPRGIDGGQAERRTLELRPGQPERGRERHPVDVPRRRGLRAVEVTMGVEPEHPTRTFRLGKTAERSEGDRVVATEDERQEAALDRTRHQFCDPLARLLDLRQEARAL